MDTTFFFRGLVIGFLIATPVGPIGILCVRRTLVRGRIHGLASGLGAATADAVYGFIAAFSLTFVSDFLVAHQTLIRIIGAIVICALGIRTYFSRVTTHSESPGAGNLFADFISAFGLTLMNPITLLAFTAVFAGIGIAHSTQTVEVLLVAGVFSGASIWWLSVTAFAGLLHRKISTENLAWLTKLAGIGIICFGLFIFFDTMF